MSSTTSSVDQNLLTLGQLLHRLLPHGTLPYTADESIDDLPLWPPDLFAVTASVVDLTGCYSFYRYISGPAVHPVARSNGPSKTNHKGRFFTPEKIKQVEACADRYGHVVPAEEKKGSAADKARKLQARVQDEVEREKYLQGLWTTIVKRGDVAIADLANEQKETACRDALMELLSVADCAAGHMGFFTKTRGVRPFADLLIDEYQKYYAPQRRRGAQIKLLAQLPGSICLMVPATEACVQPKTMTPQCGCTLRSLSHNLALLPPNTKVRTEWTLSVRAATPGVPRSPLPYNMLLVPYPYVVNGDCISDAGNSPTGVSHLSPRTVRTSFFEVRQRWLEDLGRTPATRAAQLADFVAQLAKRATKQVDHVDMVIFPELSLDKQTADGMARLLFSRVRGLECLIAGVLAQQGDLSMNTAQTYAVDRGGRGGGESHTSWQQAKHHRWKLDDSQICRYHLGGQLNPVNHWWEHIDLRTRECHFFVFRHGMSLATLICEDLARVDPVQSVIRSVGPNLVIALLMDGPQLERRWGGRYATVLADDPGSAVLTLTSAGMVARSAQPGESVPREIALWKGYEGIAQELKLPSGSHALLVTLTRRSQEHFTLDGRSDQGFTHCLKISGVHGIRHPNPPDWARLPN